MPKYGFNFQWMFVWRGNPPMSLDERALDFMASHGFDFVRIPTDYRFWIRDFDYLNPDETVFEFLDDYLAACRARSIHMCLNLHRVPGYCINRVRALSALARGRGTERTDTHRRVWLLQQDAQLGI